MQTRVPDSKKAPVVTNFAAELDPPRVVKPREMSVIAMNSKTGASKYKIKYLKSKQKDNKKLSSKPNISDLMIFSKHFKVSSE